MNKLYVVIPGFLLTLFAWFHHAAEGDRLAFERQREATRAEAQRIDDERREAIKRKSLDDANARAAERERLAREAAEKRRAEQEAVLHKIETEAATFATEVTRLESEMTAVGNGLAELRTKRETLERDTFALARNVEAKRVERRTAELEIQRATRILISRLDESALANPPAASANR